MFKLKKTMFFLSILLLFSQRSFAGEVKDKIIITFNDICSSIALTISTKLAPTNLQRQDECFWAIADNLLNEYSKEEDIRLIVNSALNSENIDEIARDFSSALLDIKDEFASCYVGEFNCAPEVIEFDNYSEISIKDYIVEVLKNFEKKPLLERIAQKAKFVGKCGLGGLTCVSGGMTVWSAFNLVGGAVTAHEMIWVYGGIFVVSSIGTYKVFSDSKVDLD